MCFFKESYKIDAKSSNFDIFESVLYEIWEYAYNPNAFTGLVGKVQKTISRRRKAVRVEKKVHAAGPRGPGLEPRTYRMLG